MPDLIRELSVEAVLARLIQALCAKNESELARTLGLGSSTISTWKKRGSVPLAICEELARQRGLSMDWLLYGEGTMRRGDATTPVDASAPVAPREQAILELFRALDEDAQREIQDAAAEKKRLRDLEQRFNELAAAFADIKRPA